MASGNLYFNFKVHVPGISQGIEWAKLGLLPIFTLLYEQSFNFVLEQNGMLNTPKKHVKNYRAVIKSSSIHNSLLRSL